MKKSMRSFSWLLATVLALYPLLCVVRFLLPAWISGLSLPAEWFDTTAAWFFTLGALSLLLPANLNNRPLPTRLFVLGAFVYLVLFGLTGWMAGQSRLAALLGARGDIVWPGALLGGWLLAFCAVSMRFRRLRHIAAACWAYLMMAAAALDIAGNLLKLSLIYEQPLLVPVPMPLAFAIFVLGAALLSRQQRIRAQSMPGRTREDMLISSIGLWLLITIGFITGLTTFISVQSQVEAALYQHVMLTMNNRGIIFQNAIDAAYLDSAAIMRNPEIAQLVRSLSDQPDERKRARLLALAADRLPYTVRALRFISASGATLAQRGEFTPAEVVWIDHRDKAELRFQWREGLPFIELRLNIEGAGFSKAGEAIIELPAPAWEQLFTDTYDLGRTGEMLVCGIHDGQTRCLGSRHRYALYSPKEDGPLAELLNEALAGERSFVTKPIIMRDDDNRPVVLAYSPVGRVEMALHIAGNGLAMLITVRAEEFYEPVRVQLHRVLPILLAIIVVGSLLLRSLIVPLVRALRDKESRFRELSELSSDCYWLMDAHFRFTEITGKALVNSGIVMEEWLERHWSEVPARVEDEEMLAQLSRLLAMHEPFYDIVFRIHAPNGGEPHFISLSGAPLYAEDGRFIGFRGVGKDVSRRKIAEEGLREAQLGLERRVEERTAELSESNKALAIEVQERRQAEERVKRSEGRFRSLTELSSDWYWEQDEHFRFTQISGEVDRKGGFSAALSLGKPLWQQSWVIDGENDWEPLHAWLDARNAFHDFVIKTRDMDGQVRYLSISGQPVFNEDGGFCGFRGIGKDVTEQKLSEERIHFLAHYDALTHLPNRVLLGEQVRFAVERARRAEQHFALLFIDLDRFKIINDSLGHDAGDQVLRVVAQRLSDVVRDSDMVVRLGGDEFVVLLENIADTGQVSYTARRILEAINRPFTLAGEAYYVGASIGISLFPEDGESLLELLKHSDAAMYRAKEEGRNGIFFFSNTVNASAVAVFRLESDLRQALEQGQLLLYYQPKLDLHSRTVAGVEALIRWRHPSRGMISPAEFIPVAEECGLIAPIGEWVLHEALKQLQTWDRSGLPALTMAVNLSPRQLQDSLIRTLTSALELYGVQAERLELELTENLMLQRPERDIELLKAIKQTGIRISLDDFGTGFSSLSSLATLPLDCVKMDRTFVDRLPDDKSCAAISRSILTMAKGIGLTVVAEGVENDDQWQWLTQEGCHQIQGYRFCKPLPADEAYRFIADYASDS